MPNRAVGANTALVRSGNFFGAGGASGFSLCKRSELSGP